MWNQKKISVVIPAYNEEECVREIIEEVFKQPFIDEVIVVDNNSKDKTAEEIKKTKAKLVTEHKQGYGFALRKGMSEATGDLIILFDADGNFLANDILKLLAYEDSFDFVKGTRSRRELTEKGIYNPFTSYAVIIANILVSKFQQLLFRGPSLTDAGCTMRLIKKDAFKKIGPYLTVGKGHFLTDLTNLAMIAKISIIEIPVHFRKRIGGKSKHGNFWGLSKIALAMILLTIKQRIISWTSNRYKF